MMKKKMGSSAGGAGGADGAAGVGAAGAGGGLTTTVVEHAHRWRLLPSLSFPPLFLSPPPPLLLPLLLAHTSAFWERESSTGECV